MPMRTDPSGNYPIFYTEEIKKLEKERPSLTIGEAGKEADEVAKVRDAAIYTQDIGFYWVLLVGLVSIVVIVVLGSIGLIAMGKEPSDGIIAIGSGAVGALIGLFSSK